MLDVHPPHHPVQAWRDFLIHIATIVIGLLIAIGLEQSIEWLHHRHLVREARENIRKELESNEIEAKKDLGYLQANSEDMKANVTKARMLRDNPHSLEHNEMHFTFAWNSFSQSAWNSARDSGALTFMPVEEVQRYADAYDQQQIVNKEAVDIFTHQSELAAPLFAEEDIAKMPREEAQIVMEGSAVAYMRLNTLHELVEELDQLYAKLLKA